MSNPGLFITFEGGDWCGKTTQVELLCATLQNAGYEVVKTFEPGDSELGQTIRQIVMHGTEIDPRTEALLYAADRAHHAAETIRPALAAGKIVISDRYWDSSITYQGAGRELGRDWIRQLSEWATGNLVPDLTILLDGDPATLREQRGGNEFDRIESADLSFHYRVRDTFRELAAAEPHRFRVVDAHPAASQVAAAIWAEVASLLKKTNRTTPENTSSQLPVPGASQ